MDTPNVNNLNGIPNFGHGLPEDGVVIAGVTDVPQDVPMDETEETVDTTTEATPEEETPSEEVDITSSDNVE